MLKRKLLISKLKGLGVHLCISALVFLPFLYLIWFVWFPPPMFFTDGGWQGLRIMLAVDMVIGPALTFIIYNPAKSRREKTFDFSCIGLVQAAALAYGYWNVEPKRIYTMAFANGAFHAVTRDDYRRQDLPEGFFDTLGDGPIYWVYARDPKNEEEAAGLITYMFMREVDQPALYFLQERLDTQRAELDAQALSLDSIDVEKYPDLARDLADFRAKHPEAKVRWFAHSGYYGPALLALDDENRQVGWIRGDAPSGSRPATR